MFLLFNNSGEYVGRSESWSEMMKLAKEVREECKTNCETDKHEKYDFYSVKPEEDNND